MTLTQLSDKKNILQEEISTLPAAVISALQTEDNTRKALEYLRDSLTFLPTYKLEELDDQLLRHVLPIFKKWLERLFEENLSIAETADDDFVLDILRENLKVTIELVNLLKKITEFILQNEVVDIMYLKDLLVNLGNCILCPFKHCKECPQNYKEKFNTELSNLFLASQELHKLFLRIIESSIVFNEKTDMLKRLLEMLCDLSEILSHVNIKSMVDNWKAYTSVSQKIVHMLDDDILDLPLPFFYLTSEIQKNLNSLEEIDTSLITQVVKITGFLIKVVLKLCDIFWQSLKSRFSDVYNFCAVIYSFPIDYFTEPRFSTEIVFLIDTSLLGCTEAFVHRLATQKWFLEELYINSHYFDGKEVLAKPLGHLNFFGSILKALVLNNRNDLDIELKCITTKIFNLIDKCNLELFWINKPTKVFDNLIIYLGALILLFEKYEDIEELLMQNILQENPGKALFALEVWSVILSNCEETSVEVFILLATFIRRYDLGFYTSRPENIYLKHLIRRIFQLLPKHMKLDLVKQYDISDNIKLWKMIGLQNLPRKKVPMIENLILTTIGKIEGMRNATSSAGDIICIRENFDLLSSVDFKEMELNTNRLIEALITVWEVELTPELIENNVFLYFFFQLEIITSALIQEFDNTHIVLILDQLYILSKHENYKLPACSVLAAISRSPSKLHEFGDQNKQRPFSQFVNIISQNLLTGCSSVAAKQAALDLLRRLAADARCDSLIGNVARCLDNRENRYLQNYLQGNIGQTSFEGLKALSENCAFRHRCLTWSESEPAQPLAKKSKGLGRVVEIKMPEPLAIANDDTPPDDSVTEILDRLKCEVKCLANALKTEQLSRKNATDLKMLANKMLSYL